MQEYIVGLRYLSGGGARFYVDACDYWEARDVAMSRVMVFGRKPYEVEVTFVKSLSEYKKEHANDRF